ncbi:MAG: PAC2 family protein [Candidatus Omnitrophota bacterium]
MQASKLWFAATNTQLRDILKKNNFSQLVEGQISGMNGLFLSLAKKAGLEGCCLLGEIPLYTIQIENPKASAVVLEGLARILGIRFDLAALNEQAVAMEEEINKLLDYLKLGSSGAPAPIGEEEIELIKKSLSQLTKLPGSVKEKIEKLFQESQLNISKANELKVELDKWNVYKEYEDRFLDLFRKNRDSGN